MTTEKEFWNLAGQYFRKELGISEDEQTIDEECVGCCKVVDVAAKLQEELESTRNMYWASSDECCKQRKIIGDYRETIRVERIDRAAEKASINHKYSEDLRKKNATIEELKDRNIEDLKELYNIYEAELRGLKADRTSIKSDRDIMFQNYRNTVAKLQDDIRGLEVELYACKEDSEVLGKVVEAIRDLQNLTGMVTTYDMRHIRDMVQDYLNAPEGPPETPIDDLYKVTVTFL